MQTTRRQVEVATQQEQMDLKKKKKKKLELTNYKLKPYKQKKTK
jgi:hypothetical protein